MNNYTVQKIVMMMMQMLHRIRYIHI